MYTMVGTLKLLLAVGSYTKLYICKTILFALCQLSGTKESCEKTWQLYPKKALEKRRYYPPWNF